MLNFSNKNIVIVCVTVTMFAAGCGQKGALYLPKPLPKQDAPAQTPERLSTNLN